MTDAERMTLMHSRSPEQSMICNALSCNKYYDRENVTIGPHNDTQIHNWSKSNISTTIDNNYR